MLGARAKVGREKKIYALTLFIKSGIQIYGGAKCDRDLD
jgi:hypothetical protein